MAIIQDLINFVPSWQKHLDESGYLKAPGQTNYHQKAGYNFKENFPNTPGYLADALGKAYQYGTEGIGSLFSNSTFPEAMARAEEESRLNSLGFRGQGFDMDEYDQTMDFARNGLNNTNIGLTYGSAQASDLTDLERDFPGMSTGDIIDSMNNRPFIGNQQAPLDMNRFRGVSDMSLIDETTNDEQVDYIPGQPKSFRDSATLQEYFQNRNPLKSIGGLLGLITGNPILGLISGGAKGLGALNNKMQNSMFGKSENLAEYFNNRKIAKATGSKDFMNRPRSERNYTGPSGGDNTGGDTGAKGAADSFSNKSGMGRTGY